MTVCLSLGLSRILSPSVAVILTSAYTLLCHLQAMLSTSSQPTHAGISRGGDALEFEAELLIFSFLHLILQNVNMYGKVSRMVRRVGVLLLSKLLSSLISGWCQT